MVDFLYPVPLLATPLHQKSPSRLSTSYLLAIHGQFQAASLLSRVGGGEGGWGGGIIKLKAKLSSTGTELGNDNNAVNFKDMIYMGPPYPGVGPAPHT